MGQFPLRNNRDRFEAAMGMNSDTARGLCRFKMMGTGIVEQQEGIEVRSFVIGEQAPDRETVSDPVPRNITDQALDSAHLIGLLYGGETEWIGSPGSFGAEQPFCDFGDMSSLKSGLSEFLC